MRITWKKPHMIPSDERKALKRIEDELSANDPALAAYLAGRIGRRHPLALSIGCYALVAAVVFCGIEWHILALIVTGIILMPLTPILVRRALRRPRTRRIR
jgi:Flp pilus assembly protein TadB